MDKESVDRKTSWWLVAITSVIALASIVSQIKYDNLAHDGYLRYIVSAAAITTGLAVIFALALSFQVNLLLKVEVPFAWANLVLWILAVRFIFHSTNLATTVQGGLVVISNANIYYFSWAGLLLSAVVVGQTKGPLRKKEFWNKVCKRFNQWGLLVLTSLVAMASAAQVYKDNTCTGDMSTSVCKDTRLAFSFGVIVAALSLIIMLAAILFRERQNCMIWVEMFAAVVGVVLFAATTRRLTKPGGLATTPGNFYYFNWFSLFVSIFLLIDCLNEKFQCTEKSGTQEPVVEAQMEEKDTPVPPPEAAAAETQV
jgi:hypothetical protein